MKLPPLNEQDERELQRAATVGKIASFSAAGDIRITPIWVWPHDDSLMMNTFENSEVVGNLRRNPKCSLMLDSTDWPYIGVHYWGTAAVEGPENDVEGIARAFAKYMNDDLNAATEYAKTLISWGARVYIRFTARRKTTWDFRQG